MEQSKFYQIKNVTEHEYTLVGCDGSVIIRSIQEIDKSASAFNIQDAKDGDVLVSKDGKDILIFRRLDSSTSFSSYYNIRGNLQIGWSNRSFIPATKEQRDTLLKAMSDAGYEFDFTTKELKKIEQKPAAWSEEDEINYNYALAACKYYGEAKGYADTETHQKANKWLKPIKDRYNWKPSDVQMRILSIYADQNNTHGSVLTSLYNDLKKLREE